MTRIGILSSAHMHAAAYVQALASMPEVELVGIFDDDQDRGQSFARQHAVPWCKDLDQLLSDVDATIVCAENARHRFFVEHSARASRPILCEKPLATTVEDATAMLSAVQSAGVALYMALPVRFAPGFGQLLEAVRGSHIGRVLAMVGTNHGYMPPGWFLDPAQSGGGAIMDHTPHVLDLMRMVSQSEVVEVYAEVASRIRQKPIDDCGILSLEFANGTFATLDPSWSRLDGFPTWGDVTLEVVGSQGVLTFDALKQHLDLYRAEVPSHRHLGFGDNMDAALVAAFLEAVTTGTPPPLLAQGVDGLRALEVAIAAYRSHQSRKPVVIERLA